MLYLLSLIKNWFLKLINLLFGKTRIFIIILAWFLIITGALFLAQPERARKKIVGYGFGFLKWPLLSLVVYAGMFLVSLGFKKSGILIASLGIIFIIWAYFFLKKKTYKKLEEQFAKIPIKFLKIFAVIQITVGALMLILQRRIW